MAKAPSALTVAITASVLLVVVVAVDLATDRTYELQVETAGGWETLATSDHAYGLAPDRFGPLVQVNETDTVRFRVLASNDRPWALSETFEVMVQGGEVHEGLLEAPAFGDGVATFEVGADQLLDRSDPMGDRNTLYASVDLRVDNTFLYGALSVKEVNA